MSVVIRGMKMPKSCDECPCYYETEGAWRNECEVLGKEYIADDYRPEWCPLVELPAEHGRLIDADSLVADIKGQEARIWRLDAVSESDYFIERNEKFRQSMFKSWCESTYAYLNTRPTIVEAEVSE